MLVKEYTTERGTKIEFYDDAYAGCDEAELERRREEIRRTAWWCARRAARRAAEREGGNTKDEDAGEMLLRSGSDR